MKILSTIAIFILCTIQHIACDDDDTLVQIEQGQIRGEILKTIVKDVEYYSYKGIRYAKPPTGNLRFKAPEEAESWDGVLNATEHGSVCPQFNPLTAVYTSGSEDCLFLNVYSPNIKTESLYPVIVFIHGGAYIFGSGNTELYGPDYLIEHETVVVTMNYRLGTLGFLSMDTADVPGNAALKDQVLALKWVQKNIALFGGDPNSVTIFGDTAGGQSVTLLMLSPATEGLFQKAVAMSGSPTCDYGLTYKPVRKAEILGQLNNCPDVVNKTKLLICLQETDYNNFYSQTPTVLAAEEITDVLFKMEHFTPVIERKTGNNFLTEDYYTTLTTGNVNKKIPFMIGYSSKEALLLIDIFNSSYVNLYNRYRELFAPSEILTKCTPDTNMAVADKVVKFYFENNPVTVENLELFLSYSSNASIAYHAQRFANKWAALGSKTYFFKFDCYTSWNVFGQQGAKYGIQGSAHFDAPYYTFHPKSLNWPVTTDSLEYKLSQDFTTALTNFAKTGDPSVEGAKWAEYDPSGKAFMTFGNDGPKMGQNPDELDNKFWEEIYEYAKIPY